MVKNMVVYLDLVFIVNFLFDFMILFAISKILKLQVKIGRLVLGSFVGSLTIFSLFLKFNTITLLVYKVVVSIVIVFVTFGKGNLVKKIYYFYFVSIIVGGFIYFVKLQLTYSSNGLVFNKNNLSFSMGIYILITPVMLYSYIKEIDFFKYKRSIVHNVVLVINNKRYQYNGYIDTGNSLYDPFKKRGVLILYDKNFKIDGKFIYVSYNTLDGGGVIPCVKIDELYIDGNRVSKEYLLGVASRDFKIKNVEANIILHKDLLKL